MNFYFFIISTIISTLLISCSDTDIVEEFYSPYILRNNLINNENLHLAFPTIAGNADRSKIVVIYREGTDHMSFDGKLIQLESFDKGKSWINRKVIYSAGQNIDVRDPQLLELKDGLLCRFFERVKDSNCKVKSIKSSDYGTTYNTLVDFPYPGKETTAASRGNMVIINDTIYSICYNRWAVTWLMKSTDFGESWEVVSWLDERLWTGKLEQGRINEASLGYYDGKMYIVGRQYAENKDQRLEIGVSKDLGKTWEWSFLPVEGQAPSLTNYKDSFILTYRNVKNSQSGEYRFETALLKDGKLIGKPITLFESKSFDIGYGDVLTMPQSFLICCYQPAGIVTYEIQYDIFNQ